MELYVRIFDKPFPEGHDPVKAAKLGKRGDVIAAFPNGHEWGRAELASPEHIVIRTAITQAEAEALLAIEPGDRTTNRMLRKRAFRLDCDALELDYTGQRTAVRVSKSAPAVRAAKQQKEPLQDPSLIDPRPLVIG